MDATSELRCRLQNLVREAQHKLRTSEDEKELQLTLQGMTALLPGGKWHPALAAIPKDKLHEAHLEFMDRHYVHFAEFLLSRVTANWLGKVSKGRTESLFDAFFLCGAPVDSFTLLSGAFAASSVLKVGGAYTMKSDSGASVGRLVNCVDEPTSFAVSKTPERAWFCGFKLRKCQSLLERFVRGDCFDQLLSERCVKDKAHSRQTWLEGRRVNSYEHQLQDKLVSLIATLPDRVTGKLKADTSDFFFPSSYVPHVAAKLVVLLKKLHNQLRTSQDCSVAFLGHLLGKMCITGHGEALWSSLLPAFVRLTRDDFLWRRLLSALLTGVSDHCLESTLVPLVKQAPWYGVLTRLLGQQVLTNQKLQYILTNKLLLLRHFTQNLVLQNIIGYLATSGDTASLYTEVFHKLLQVWGDVSALQHTSYDQHLYITKAILVCTSFIDEDNKSTLQTELLSELLPGLQSHLDSALVNVRTLGMIVGENLTLAIDPHGQKLSFQYEQNEETRDLVALLTRPVDPGMEADDKCEDSEGKDSGGMRDKIAQSSGDSEKQTESPSSETQLDSDDDLEPYDMSNDVKVEKVKAPRYIRDCLEGLVCSDDTERVAVCLRVTEQLIRQHPSSAAQNAVELTKVLLHLQDSCGVEMFTQYRYRAMVALAVTAPAEVADYLCHEFYERNYNVRQRLDMLEIVAAAAQELSQPDTSQCLQKSVEPIQPMSPGPDGDWREIVQRRIDAKTRRFGKGSQKMKATPTLNRFAPVAGHFFFSLVTNFGQRDASLDLEGRDHLVLGRLLYTLGVVVHAAVSLPVVGRMAKVMLELVWCLRYHSQPAVRQALLFAVTMVILSVPTHLLLSDLRDDATETRGWLEDVVEKDVDQESRKMAMQALVLLQNSIQQGNFYIDTLFFRNYRAVNLELTYAQNFIYSRDVSCDKRTSPADIL